MSCLFVVLGRADDRGHVMFVMAHNLVDIHSWSLSRLSFVISRRRRRRVLPLPLIFQILLDALLKSILEIEATLNWRQNFLPLK